MAVVYLNLNVNWACILLVNMKNELKKIKHKFDNKGVVTQFKIKNRINFGTKISLLILKSFQLDQWVGAVGFNVSKTLPKDTRQFLMALRINNNAYLSASDMVRPYMLEIGPSIPTWTIPQANESEVEGQPTTKSLPGKKRKAPASSSQSKKKKVAPQISLRSLIDEPDVYDIPLDGSASQDQSEPSGYAPSLPASILLHAIIEEKLARIRSPSQVIIEEEVYDDNEVIEVNAKEVDWKMQRDQAMSLQWDMEQKDVSAVNTNAGMVVHSTISQLSHPSMPLP